MAHVEIENLRKEFDGGVVAVADVSIDIREGEFLTMLGPSGCGKSTTLRMVAGLETPTSGLIRFDGEPVTDLPPAKRNVAMVFQSYALYPHMTVRANLEYPLRKRGVGAAERAKRSSEVAEMLQIAPLLSRKPRQLSGGQQQRVALGRALIRSPRVFLLDEPLSNLDAKLRAYMRAEMIQLHRRLGTTTIYVTHDQLEAMTMSDRIAVFDAGRLRQIGTPAEIYRNPRNRTVAGFVGTPTMNFLDAVPVAATGGPAIQAAGLRLSLRETPSLPGNTGPLVLGVRSEDVLVGVGAGRAEVVVLEPAGHETMVTLATEGGRIVARVAPDTVLAVGEIAPFSLRPSRLHFFDQAGERLDLVPAVEVFLGGFMPADAPTASELRELMDRLQIADAYVRYAIALDDQQRDLLAQIFDEDTTLHSANPAVPKRTGFKANWERLVRRHEEEEFRERHVTTAPVILELTADRCEAVAECVILKRPKGGAFAFEMIGFYRDTLVKKNGRWVFRSRFFTPDI